MLNTFRLMNEYYFFDLLAELERLDAVPLPVSVVGLERLLREVLSRLLLVRAGLCVIVSCITI